nr:unnamed protein product [Callosobruchus analis]
MPKSLARLTCTGDRKRWQRTLAANVGNSGPTLSELGSRSEAYTLCSEMAFIGTWVSKLKYEYTLVIRKEFSNDEHSLDLAKN